MKTAYQIEYDAPGHTKTYRAVFATYRTLQQAENAIARHESGALRNTNPAIVEVKVRANCI